MHRQIVKTNHPTGRILEYGAGILNHVPYETNYISYDVVEPNQSQYSKNPEGLKKEISAYYKNIQDIDHRKKYDRILSVAVLEHIENLPEDIALCALKLNSGGLFQAGIPCEGEALWTVASYCSTGIAYRIRTGLSYRPLIRNEHINASNDIVTVLRYFFEEVTVKRFPLPFKHLSFYMYLEASKPRFDNCKIYLDKNISGI